MTEGNGSEYTFRSDLRRYFFLFLKDKDFLKITIYFSLIICVGVSGPWRLEVRSWELQVVMNCRMWMLGTELVSFLRAKRASSC